MEEKVLLRGNEAMAETAIRRGCRYYFGYPITPSTEVLEYMAHHLPKRGGEFVQAESEVAAINMLYGASAAGGLPMTATSSPGFSLMQEGLSYMASAELPCLLANISRAGPGLGTLPPSQGDYFQATKGGGHGDYHLVVLAPWSVQEMSDFTKLGFDLAESYRIPVLILADGMLGQMMEGVQLPSEIYQVEEKIWSVQGNCGSKRNIVLSHPMTHENLIRLNEKLQSKYADIKSREARWEYETDMKSHFKLLVVAFGSAARVAQEAIDRLNNSQEKVASMFRPITLWPYPSDALKKAAASAEKILVVEMNSGQMLEDVQCSLPRREVHFHGKAAAGVPSPEELYQCMSKLI